MMGIIFVILGIVFVGKSRKTALVEHFGISVYTYVLYYNSIHNTIQKLYKLYGRVLQQKKELIKDYRPVPSF